LSEQSAWSSSSTGPAPSHSPALTGCWCPSVGRGLCRGGMATATSRASQGATPRRPSGGPPRMIGESAVPEPHPVTPVRNDGVTVICGVCGTSFAASGRRRWCSDACRQAAWRRRVTAPRPSLPARADTVYECPACEAGYLGEQRCEDCHLWCRRLGPGGPCPHCDEVVVLADLLRPDQLAEPPPPPPPPPPPAPRRRPKE